MCRGRGSRYKAIAKSLVIAYRRRSVEAEEGQWPPVGTEGCGRPRHLSDLSGLITCDPFGGRLAAGQVDPGLLTAGALRCGRRTSPSLSSRAWSASVRRGSRFRFTHTRPASSYRRDLRIREITATSQSPWESVLANDRLASLMSLCKSSEWLKRYPRIHLCVLGDLGCCSGRFMPQVIGEAGFASCVGRCRADGSGPGRVEGKVSVARVTHRSAGFGG